FAALENDPNVRYVSPNRPNRSFLDLSTAAVSAGFAWQYGLDGTGIGVAVIDSGLMAKADDLMDASGVSRIVYGEGFGGLKNDAKDHYGHGTHVAGIIGATGKDSTGLGFVRTFKGVAPNVTFVDLRVLDDNGV